MESVECVCVRDAIMVTRDWNKGFQKYKQEGLQHVLPWDVALKSWKEDSC